MCSTNDNFQKLVESMLIQHQSILDILSKGQEASAKVNRAVVKSVTSCGCVAVDAHKYTIPEEATLADLKFIFNTQLEGALCDNCCEVIVSELGKQLFYIAALANTLNLSIDDILEKERQKLNTLTVYNLR